MIAGGVSWLAALNSQNKAPLYVFTIPGKSTKLCSFYPLTQATNASSCLPILNIPKGASQKIDELEGRSNISPLDIQAVDPSGALKSLAADVATIGQPCQLLMGFPGLDITDVTQFVPIHTGIISKVNRDPKGLFTLTAQDPLVFMANQIFLNGGPPQWTQFGGNAKVSLTSSSAADARIITIVGWNTTGTALLTELVKLTGSSEVLSQNTYSQIISITSNFASALWTITVKEGSGGTTRGTIPRGSSLIGGPIQMPNAPPAYLDNAFPISTTNPRFLSGNPMDMLIAVQQNEIGLGQTDPPVLVITTGGGSGTGQAGFGINPTWTRYDGATGLINPNTYLDVDECISLRDTDFARDRFEFILDSAQNGKSWVESELMKIMGLYWITRGDGKLTPKSMKTYANPGSVAISDRNIIGIPDTQRWPVINVVQFLIPTDADGNTNNQVPITFANQTSLNLYKGPYVHQIQSAGLRLGYGGFTRMFILANRIFARHAFATPEYTFTTFLKFFGTELGEHFSLTHPKLVDLKTGTVGVTSILCEVTERTPDYSTGQCTYKCIDTRFIGLSNGGFEIAAVGDAIPVYGSASSGQRAQYMFITNTTGNYSTGASGNQID